MDIKDPIGHNASVVEMIRRFQGVFFSLWVPSQQTGWRDKVIGSRGQTADLSPHSCAVISHAVGSDGPRTQEAPAATQRQLLLLQRDHVLESFPLFENNNVQGRLHKGQRGETIFVTGICLFSLSCRKLSLLF